jgi:hypothetical protein
MKTGEEGMYIPMFFFTLALIGSEQKVWRLGRFTSGEKAPVPTGKKAGWAPESVWTKFLPLPGLELQPVAIRYTDWAILAR